jgi:carboxymethylenebutenolidase
MKNIILILFLALIARTYSQNHMSCCDETSAPGRMAAFTDDKNFRDLHEAPIPFRLADQKGKMVSFNTSDGKTANAYEVKAASQTSKWILVFHEWWGLNDYIKQESDEWSDKLGVNVLALDLYDGKVATTPEDAGKYVKSVDNNRAFSIIKGAADYAGSDAVFGTLGWCFGGGWSLQAAITLENKCIACVMYYGMPEDNKDRLAKLQAPVLGIFGKLDGYITPEVVAKFEDNMKSINKPITTYSYDAVHGFANPSNPKFDKDATKDAKEKTLAFFKDNLK